MAGSAVAGGGAFTLTVFGSNFIAASVVRWNGADRSTTLVSATQLTAAISAADIAAAGAASVTVFNPAPGGGASNSLSFTISAPRPAVYPGGVVNAGSFAPGAAVAPGIVSLFGSNLARGAGFAAGVPLPTSLQGATVMVNNIPAPLFYVSPGQINLQIPWELLPVARASLTVSLDGVASNAESLNLSPAAPGIFTLNQSGSGQAAVQIANTVIFAAPAGSVPGAAARPVNRGEYLTIYCTGLGDVTNRPANGAAALGSPLSQTVALPTVTIGGASVPVTFAGLAPSFVALYQVNVPVLQNVPTGDTVELVITVGGVRSNAVTIAVR